MNDLSHNRIISVEGNVDRSLLNTGDGNTFNIFHSPSIPIGGSNPFGVPYQRNSYFTGRENVLTHLHEQLTQSAVTATTQVQAISGLGGVGKTQTAVEYAYRHHYDHRTYNMVFWVKADTKANVATDFAEIANQLALSVAQSTQAEKVSAVQAWLSTHRKWLLVFDNVDTPEWLMSFMPTNPNGRVLVTSRSSILTQLGIRRPIFLDVLSSDEATSLLFERTECERTDTNIAAATELNEELDGLPLALEQASAFIVRQRIDVATYLRIYRKQGLSQLEKEKAKTGQYSSSVLKTWTINFEAVSERNPAAAALLQTSAFLAPNEIPYCILISGAAYLGETLSSYFRLDDRDDEEMMLALSELIALLDQYSLVSWEPERKTYSVHRLVQKVVRNEVAQAPTSLWLERVISAVVAAYPGQGVNHWRACTRMLPHWLIISQQAQEIGYESANLGRLCEQAGLFLYEQGRYSEAEFLQKQALGIRQNLGKAPADVARSLNKLGQIYEMQGRYGEAEPLYEKALKLRQEQDDKPLDLADSLASLSGLYESQGHYRKAERPLKQAINLSRRSLGENHINVATSLGRLAQIYEKQGRYSEAEPLCKEALELYQHLLGDKHPYVASGLNNLAGLYESQQRYDEVEPLYQQALEMRQELLGEDHPDVATVLNNLSHLYEKQGRYSKAEPLCKKALDIRRRRLGDEHPLVANSLGNLATIYCDQGRYSKAELLYKQALGICQHSLGENHPETQLARRNLQILPLLANALQTLKSEKKKKKRKGFGQL